MSILCHWFLSCQCSIFPSPVWPCPVYLDLWMHAFIQVLMHYWSLQHLTWFSPPDTSITEDYFHFGPTTLFFLELLAVALCSSPVGYWAPSNLGAYLPVWYHFAISSCSRGSHGKNIGVHCHFPLQWTMFCQNSSPGPSLLGGPAQDGSLLQLVIQSPSNNRAMIYEGVNLCTTLFKWFIHCLYYVFALTSKIFLP